MSLEVAAGSERLAGFDDLWDDCEHCDQGTELSSTYEEVLGIDIAMLGEVEVLLGHEHTLSEEVLVDLLSIRLGDEPA